MYGKMLSMWWTQITKESQRRTEMRKSTQQSGVVVTQFPCYQWWARFSAFGRAFYWSFDDQCRRLPSLVTRKAFHVIGELLIEDREPMEILELYRSTLQQTFGWGQRRRFCNFAIVCLNRQKKTLTGTPMT